MNPDTICAISTPYGCGGIAVVRVSGPKAIEIVDSLLRTQTPLHEAAARTAHYGTIIREDEVLDEVVATLFRAPHSFTGEDVVELSCHGSTYIQQELIRWLIEAGCRMARAGEFTQRAFMNGKMDLTRAEAVADLIASETKAEKDLALSQLRGSISTEIKTLREQLLRFTSLIELELDFADHEELEFANRDELRTLAEHIAQRLKALTGSFKTGNAIRNGIPVAIIGAANAGKSTLMNALMGEERAIVSDIQGTTRDTIEDTLTIEGIPYRLIDTAGIRPTEDQLEQMGIARSRQAAEKAQIILHLIDATAPETDIPITSDATIIEVWNKCDLATPQGGEIHISARNGEVAPIRAALTRIATEHYQQQGAMLSNARHYEALMRAEEAIERVLQGMDEGLSGEWLSMDLRDALQALGEVSGEISSQEVLNNIFSHFCIGK